MKKVLLLEIFDEQDDRLVDEIDISHYPLSKINEICPPVDFPDDFEYCDGHFVTENQFLLLKEFIVELSERNYNGFIYNISTQSIK